MMFNDIDLDKYCLNYILTNKFNLEPVKECLCTKKNKNIKFCSKECEEINKYNKCQSYINYEKGKSPSIKYCNIFKPNKLFTHCNSKCKNHFISTYKIKKIDDDKTRASFCLIYKIIDDINYILVHKRKNNLSVYDNQIYLPGGKVECGETYLKALIREIKEEVNIDLNPVIDKIDTIANVNKIMIIFSININDLDITKIKTDHHEYEIDSYKWININTIEEEYKDDRDYISLIKIIRFIKNGLNAQFLFTPVN